MPGVLYCPGAAGGGQVLIRAMRLDGNLAGYAEGKINNKPLSEKASASFLSSMNGSRSIWIPTRVTA